MSAKLRLLCLCVLPLLLSACNRPLVTADPPLPTSKPIETGPLDAKATLTIVRTTSLMIGSFTITGAIPLFFGTSEDEQPGPIHVFGTGTGTASLDSGAQGTSFQGGTTAYDITAEWPAEYEAEGWLVVGADGCKLTMDITEALLLSRVVMVNVGGIEVPVSAEDEFASFPKLEFTDQFDPEPRTGGGAMSTFTLDDVCMPAWMGCANWKPCS